jgi:hypothetical protein
METQKTLDNQSNSKEKFNTRGITIPDLKLYYRHINKNSMVLAQNQIGKPIDQNRSKHKRGEFQDGG